MAFTKAGLWGPEAIIDSTGHPLPGAAAALYLTDGVTLASLWTTSAKSVVMANPTQADIHANLHFYADPGQYRLKVNVGTVVTWLDVEVPIDPGEAAQDQDVVAAQAAAEAYADGIVAAGLATKQPLDSDLTAIAALATTAFGRGLLILADAAAGRSAFGSVIGTDVQAHDSDLDAIAALATTAFGRALLVLADAAALRTAAGLGTAATHATGDFDAAGTAAAAVAALVAGAPGALDTLNELATALADDANFATTITNALAGKQQAVARTAVKTTNYLAAAGDLVPVDTTSGAVTVTLPNAPTDKSTIAVKHIIQGGTNVVTIACAGADVFNRAGGGTSATLPYANQAMLLEYTAAGAIWSVIADDLPLSQLDLRFAPITGIPESAVTSLATDLAAKAPILAPTAVKTGNYTAAAADYVLCDTSGGIFTVTLPTAPADKTTIAVDLVASGNTLTIARGGADVFQKAGGPTSLTMNTANRVLVLQYQSSIAVWHVQDHLPAVITTKGDLLTYSTERVRLPVGGDGALLGADSTQTTGLKWIPSNAYVSAAATQSLADKGAQARANLGVRLPAAPSVVGLIDDFQRADLADLSGTAAPSGHVYRIQGTSNPITNGRYAPLTPATAVNILYTDHEGEPLAISCEFQFIAGATNKTNAVIGCCDRAFGGVGDGGSIQLSVYPNGVNGDGTGTDWQLFTVADPVVDPYPQLASGNWVSGFHIVQAADATAASLAAAPVYRMELHRTAPSTLAIVLPDGQIASVTDATIASRWGAAVGLQLRRQNSTDGYAQFCSVRTSMPVSWRKPQPTRGSPLILPGTDVDSVIGQRPTVALNGDVDIRAKFRLATMPPAASTLIGRWWGTDGGTHGLQVFVNASGRPVLNFTSDGNTVGGAQSTAIPTWASNSWVWLAITRNATTGDLIYYTATSDAALDLPTSNAAWTKLGATVATTPGAVFQSTAPIELGRRTITATADMNGVLAVFVIRNGLNGTIWSQFDTRGTWAGVDTAGNIWTMRGDGATWEIGENQVANLAADLSTINGQIATLSSATAPFASVCDTTQAPAAAGSNGQEQTFFTFATMSPTLLHVGTVLRLRLFGDASGISGSVITGRVRIGSAAGAILSSFTINASLTGTQTNKPWTLDMDIYVDATGAGGGVSAGGSSDGVATGGGNVHTSVEAVAQAYDLSAGLIVAVTFTTTTANASNVARLLRGVLSQVPST